MAIGITAFFGQNPFPCYVYHMHYGRTLAMVLAVFCLARPCGADHPPIHLILIDKATTDSLGPLPWPRNRHAKLVNILCGAGARAIALCFHYKNPGPGRGDEALASAMAKCGKVYIQTGGTEEPQSWEPDAAWLGKISLRAEGKQPGKLVDAGILQLPVKAIADSAAGLGAMDRLVGSDKNLGSLPLMISHGDLLIPSMGFRIFLDLEGMGNEPLVLKKGKQIIISHKKVNLDRYGGALINITPPGSAYPIHSFVAVLKGKVAPATFKDAIIIVGVADPQSDISTATGPKNSLELVADQIATLYGFMTDKEE